MAYDSNHKKIIAYGGRTGFLDFENVNETWSFDYESKTWKNLQPANSPPWRSSHAMVYDPVRRKVLMFGGSDFKRAFNDLWEYDFGENKWTAVAAADPPEPRLMHGMAYILNQDVVIVFGGRRANGGASFADTWEFNFKTMIWKKLNTQNKPPVSDHVNLAYDTSEKKLFLFSNPETWAYDLESRNWENLNPKNSPDSGHSNLVYDPVRKKLVLFGDSKNSHRMFTWSFDYSENEWTNITPGRFPSIDFTRASVIEHDGMVYLDQHNVFIQIWRLLFESNA